MNDTGTLEAGDRKTIEEVAMAKVTDPFSHAFEEPYPLWHGTEIEKLPDILREGIVAEDFAKRIGKTRFRYRRNWNFQAKWNNKYVSLARGDTYGNSYFSYSVSILVEPTGEIIEPPRELSSGNTGDIVKPYDYELLVKNRISPREFKGLSVRTEADVDKILSVMRGLPPSRALPIYFRNSLVWPVRMTREQLEAHVQSKV